jgi:hypothetical protein
VDEGLYEEADVEVGAEEALEAVVFYVEDEMARELGGSAAGDVDDSYFQGGLEGVGRQQRLHSANR